MVLNRVTNLFGPRNVTNSYLIKFISRSSSNFQRNIADIDDQYVLNTDKNEAIKRPNNWGGYIIVPNYFEFCAGRKNRQHDRFVYEKKEEWLIRRLFP